MLGRSHHGWRPFGSRSGTVGLLAIALAFGIGGGCATSLWPGPVTDHFDGWRFHQPEPLTIGFFDWLKRAFSGNRRGPWREYTDTLPVRRRPCESTAAISV